MNMAKGFKCALAGGAGGRLCQEPRGLSRSGVVDRLRLGIERLALGALAAHGHEALEAQSLLRLLRRLRPRADLLVGPLARRRGLPGDNLAGAAHGHEALEAQSL